jgi:DNA polymerase-4
VTRSRDAPAAGRGGPPGIGPTGVSATGQTGPQGRPTGVVPAARCVLHVDMDAFFVAVEIKEHPALRGRPVVVGGTGRRGVVASANYEARAFGVHSAMPMGQARRLCPRAVVLPGNFELYHAYSRRLHEIFTSYTPLVEGIGLDEAFLDVTGATALFGPPPVIATSIRQTVKAELGLDCSVGVAPNKLVAKLASKAAKPKATSSGPLPGRGVVVVPEEQLLDFIWALPVDALWGVGPASGARLGKLGVTTVRQLAALPAQTLEAALGRTGGHLLHELSWGRDPRLVEPSRPTKSIGHEETYPRDLFEPEEMQHQVVRMADAVASRVRQNGSALRTITLKVRYGDFTTLTRSHTFPVPQTSGPVLARQACALLAALDVSSGVRLLGVSASGLVPIETAPGYQLELDLMATAEMSSEEGWGRATAALDSVRARFGDGAIAPAALLGPNGPRLKREGDNQWGPQAERSRRRRGSA